MLLKEKCAWCNQRDGCGFKDEEGDRKIPEGMENVMIASVCVRCICSNGLGAMAKRLRAIEGQKEYYLEFKFPGKPMFFVNTQTREVFQKRNEGELVPVGVVVGKE